MIEIHADPAMEIAAIDDLDINSSESVVVVTPGDESQVIIEDKLFDLSESAITQKVIQLSANRAAAWESQNNAVATVDATGLVESISNGSTNIICRTKNVDKAVAVTAEYGGSADVYTPVEYIAGSLGRDISDTMTALVTAGTDKVAFSTLNFGSSYVRNPSFWLADYDWSGCAQAYNGGRYYMAAAISPLHVLSATHVNANIGGVYDFVDQDGVRITRTITAISSLGMDIRICKLNTALPANVAIYKVFPANLNDYLRTATLYNVPIVIWDQERKGLMQQWYDEHVTVGWGYMRQATSGAFAPVSELIIPGDSSSPCFAIVNDEPVLLGAIVSQLVFDSIHRLITEINSAMTSLGGGHQLTQIDLTSFTDFG